MKLPLTHAAVRKQKDRVWQSICDMQAKQTPMGPEVLEQYGRAHKIFWRLSEAEGLLNKSHITEMGLAPYARLLAFVLKLHYPTTGLSPIERVIDELEFLGFRVSLLVEGDGPYGASVTGADYQ